MSKSENFDSTLRKAIAVLLEHKPDYVQPISNITNLCKLLGLDFFQDSIQEEDDNVTSENSASIQQRLSIAGKILVLDIDYTLNSDTGVSNISNVMLVLASNFDQFNYKNENGENIFLNNFTKETKLAKFNHNLKILKAMDDFSDVELIDSDDCFQYYQKTINSIQNFCTEKLNIPKESIFVNKDDEFNLTLCISGKNVLQLIPSASEPGAAGSKKLFFDDVEMKWAESEVPANVGCIQFEIRLIADIAFNERMSSMFGSEKFQNNKSLTFFELKKSEGPFYLSADFLNIKFKFLWKWIFWYTNILEGQTTVDEDGETMMKNGQLLKFENEIGTWSF
ncbi:hypothetical protein QEN19_003787 [Hanseniaspora menglaensis]